MPQKTKVTFQSKYFLEENHIDLMKSALAKLINKHPEALIDPEQNQILVCSTATSAPKLDPNGVAITETIEGEYYYVFFTVHIKPTDPEHTHSDQILPQYLGTKPSGAAPLRLFPQGNGNYHVEDCTGCNCKN